MFNKLITQSLALYALTSLRLFLFENNVFSLSSRHSAMNVKTKVQSPLTKMFSHRSPSQVNVKEPVKEHLWDLHFAEFGR